MNKKTIVYIFAAVVFVLFMTAAVWLYNIAGNNYKGTQYIVPNKKETLAENSNTNSQASDNESDNESNSDIKNDETSQENENLAPDFTVFDADGNRVKLSSKFGKPIIMNFWATWCSPCRSELPSFEALYNKYSDKVEFVMINLDDSKKDVEKFIDENKYTFPVVYDTQYEASYIYGASSIPLTVIIYDDGTIYGGKYGAMEKEEIEYYIMDVLEKKQ